ncbi:hypothetical protein NSA56_01885 [Oceanobacillus caeni]|uniref:hypothetical protein n=1 Tax=Bacillaceae TaxID=186817 RepID=UPI00119D50CC|nr:MULTISPECIES: hypothetical protein [Bacillaceae]MCR1833147.1 hypothetical protein [Oceanobacillus caeni]
MNTALLSTIISASVAIFIAVLNHFIITPIKERKKRKEDQLKVLYSPLYSLICLRATIGKNISLTHGKLALGSLGHIEYQKQEYMEQMIMDRSGYCLDDLMDAWVNYSSKLPPYKAEYAEALVIAVVKGYNKLRKELRMAYNREELETGIPEVIEEYRTIMLDEE